MGESLFLQQLVNGISLGGVYALEAVGFGLIFNILKFSNFSHGGVVAISAYFGYFITQRVIHNFVISLFVTALVGGLVAVLIEKLVFRPVRLKGAPVTLLIVNSITVAMLVHLVKLPDQTVLKTHRQEDCKVAGRLRLPSAARRIGDGSCGLLTAHRVCLLLFATLQSSKRTAETIARC